MFTVGGLQGFVILAGRHWPIASPGIVLAVALFAALAAPTVWLLRRRLDAKACQVMLAVGAVATSVAVVGCGAQPSSMSAAYFYFLVVLYAAAYFRPVAAAFHVALVGALYAAALALHWTPASAAQWVQAMSVLGVVAFIVGGFAAYVRASAAALTEQVFRDQLTGLANRALFLDRLDHAIARGDRNANPVAVLYMDLDDFKDVNDGLGHATGDRLLISAAQRLVSVSRAADTLARFGGDEFAVLIEGGAMPATAQEVVDRITDAFDAPFDIDANLLSVGLSIGIAIRQPGADTDATDLLRDADLAMYQAKRDGKRRHQYACPGMLEEALAHLELIADLRRALEQQQFEVFYQPVVAGRSGRPVGVEALVRWHHPTRGLIAPGEFIGVAESSGLITQLDSWVLREACRQAQRWQAAGTIHQPFYVSVNVSPRQLAEPDLVDSVRAVLHESGLPSAALMLELTETTLMHDFDQGLTRLQELKGLGLRIALDDYGTGFSSMNRLHRLPVDTIKIDKSFIDGLGASDDATALVRSILDATHALGMASIAEGVETADQRHILELLGCDAVQGYLFARPAPAADTARTLRRLTSDSAVTSASFRSQPPVEVRMHRSAAAGSHSARGVT